MSLTFKFDQLNENDPLKKEKEINSENEMDIENYDTKASVRNLCLIEPTGKQKVFYYSDLRYQEFSPDENTIILDFTTHIVTLKGNNFETLFKDFIQHEPRRIMCIDTRYTANKEESSTYVFEMLIKRNDS